MTSEINQDELERLRLENENLKKQIEQAVKSLIEINMAVSTLGNHVERVWNQTINVNANQQVRPDG